jgi:iron complex outermembrane recepter protein
VLSATPSRGAFKFRETDGYLQNTLLKQDEPNIEELVYRLSAVWAPSDVIDMTLKWGQSQFEREGVASAVSRYLATEQERDAVVPNRSAFARAAYAVTDVFFPSFSDQVREKFTVYKDNGEGVLGSTGIGINPESSDNETQNGVFTLNYYLREHTITAITGYSEYQYVDGADVDWLPLQFIHRDDDQTFDQFSQEIRIVSPVGGFFEYVAGAYVENSRMEFERRVDVDTSLGGLLLSILGVPNLTSLLSNFQYNADILSRTHYYDLDSRSWAMFGQGTLNLTDTLRLTLGLRYTRESKNVVSAQILSDSITGLGIASDKYWLGYLQATAFDSYRYHYKTDRDTDQWIPSTNLQWDINENSMLYLTWSKGFKSGGFTAADDGMPDNLGQHVNPAVGAFAWPCEFGQDWRECYDPTNPSDDFEFEDEKVVAWEIGGKHTLLDGSMTINWAGFYTEYTNLQTSIFKGLGFGVTNAAEVTVQGGEFDILWQATERLRVGLNGAWLDAKYDSYNDAACSAVQQDADRLCGQIGGVTDNNLAGKNTTFAPEYTASIFFDYRYTLSNGMEWFSAADANYSDEYDTQGDLDPNDRVDAYTKINLRFGIRGVNNVWEVMLYGRNITDEEVAAYSFDVPILAGTHAAMYDEGAVYGVRLRYTF